MGVFLCPFSCWFVKVQKVNCVCGLQRQCFQRVLNAFTNAGFHSPENPGISTTSQHVYT